LVLGRASSYHQNFVSINKKEKIVKIAIQPNKFGSLEIKVSAIGTLASDKIVEVLNVVPEGVPKTISDSTSIKKDGQTNTTLTCQLPSTAIDGSVSISASVKGQLQALNSFAYLEDKLKADSEISYLTITPNAGTSFSVEVNQDNLFADQKFSLSSSTRQLDIHTVVTSNAEVRVSLACRFYDSVVNPFPRFKIRTKLIESCRGKLKQEVCTNTIYNNAAAVVKITFPSGYYYDELLGALVS
jgi:hypothetical protein